MLALALVMLVVLAALQVSGAAGPAPAAAQEQPATVEPTPRTAGARASYEIKFTNGDHVLAAGVDGIRMVLHEDIQVPSAISASAVQIRCSPAAEGESCFGMADSVDLDGQRNRNQPTTLTIYPGREPGGRDDKKDQQREAFTIPPGARVTVTITEEAGLTNPAEGGIFRWDVGTTAEKELEPALHPDPFVREAFAGVNRAAAPAGDGQGPAGLLVDWAVDLSLEDARRGDEVKATGHGFRSGTTVTFWRDANFDGVLDDGEETLCQDTLETGNVAHCNFTVANPPFVPGYGECHLAPSPAGGGPAARDCNFINAVDGQGHTSVLVKDEEMQANNHVVGASQVLGLGGTIEVGNLARPSPRVRVRLTDFPPGELHSVIVAGTELGIEGLQDVTVPRSGYKEFDLRIPGHVRSGRVSFQVITRHLDHGLHEDEAVVEIDNSIHLQVTPQKALANQRLYVELEGFSGTEIGGFSIEGLPIAPARVSARQDTLALDQGGRWAGTVTLPVNSATTWQGQRRLTVTDVEGRQGSALITFPLRRVTVAPGGRPGAAALVSGTGFPVGRPGEGGFHVNVIYRHDGGSASTTAETDDAGGFTAEVRIPRGVAIPSTNLVMVEFVQDGGGRVTTSAAHRIPQALLKLHPAAAPPGSVITLTGVGFRPLAPVRWVMMGGMEVGPPAPVFTDDKGEVKVRIVLPGLDAGVQTVRMRVGETTAAGSVRVQEDGSPGGALTPIAAVAQQRGEGFLRCFHFDNDTKVWSFYDSRVPDDSTLKWLVAGEPYLFNLEEATDLVLNGQRRSFTCRKDNCWNQLIW